MGHRLTCIYTRTGDDGSTGLGDGSRVAKSGPRVAAMGEVDELNAQLGLLCVLPGIDAGALAALRRVQHELFDLGGELSLPGTQLLAADAVARLEQELDAWNAQLPPLRDFVLPGSNAANAQAHLARTVCRRAERSLWQLAATETVSADALCFVNRLADWLFVLARVVAGGEEVLWQRGR